MRKRLPLYLGTILITAVLLSGFACPKSTKNLATASDAIAHSLANAQTAARQAVATGVISQADETQFESYLVKASQAGLALDTGIRANQSATTVSGEVDSFLDAFTQLNSQGVTGIKDPNLRLTISTIITGAEASVAVIEAAVGKGK